MKKWRWRKPWCQVEVEPEWDKFEFEPAPPEAHPTLWESWIPTGKTWQSRDGEVSREFLRWRMGRSKQKMLSAVEDAWNGAIDDLARDMDAANK